MQPLLLRRRQAPPSIPAFADAIVQLGTFATGDGPSALALARVALHHAPDPAYAVAVLDKLLPAYWLSWPSVGPREWLELDLRASEAERLVAVLGEWSPRDRLLLGIWLLFDVPADDLEQWIRFPEARARVMILLRHVARTLGWAEPDGRSLQCSLFMDILVEADDKQGGRQTRLHLLGCRACQEERTALQHARFIILRSWSLMFRPPRFSGPTTAYTVDQRERRQWLLRRSVGLVMIFVIGFAASRISAQTPPPPPVAAVPVTAQGLLVRALHRWEQVGSSGILHERYRVLSGSETLVIERWYDQGTPHRLRVVVHTMNGDNRLDLVTDGDHQLSYTVAAPPFTGRTVSFEASQVANVLPLLRQLPVVGPLGSFPGDMRNSDVALLWAAQQAAPRLLGTSVVGGRPVAHLLFAADTHLTVHMLIDRQTGAVLQATRLDSDTGQSQMVWQADVLETLPSASQIYDTAEHYDSGMPDPRTLLAPPPTDLTVSTLLTREMPVVFPASLPAPVLGAFLHDQAGPSLPVEQIYQGEDWRLILNTSRTEFQHGTPPTFEQHTGSIAYTIISGGPDDFVHVEWQWGTITGGDLFFWHAGLRRDQQAVQVRSILQSLTLLTPANAPEIQRRFVVPGTAGTTSSLPVTRHSS